MTHLRLWLSGAFLLSALSLAPAQVALDSNPPRGIACAYNTTNPTLTDGQPGWVQCDSTGRLIVSPTASAPQYTAMTGAQYAQAAATAQSLTIPTGALYARVCAITGQMNFVDSSGDTPTTGAAPTVGTPLAAGACIFESGASVLSVFKLINAVAATGTWTAVYFK